MIDKFYQNFLFQLFGTFLEIIKLIFYWLKTKMVIDIKMNNSKRATSIVPVLQLQQGIHLLHQPNRGRRVNDAHSAGAPLRLHCSRSHCGCRISWPIPSAAPRAISCSLGDTAIAPLVTPADHFAADLLACVSTNCTFPSASAAQAPPFASSPRHTCIR